MPRGDEFRPSVPPWPGGLAAQILEEGGGGDLDREMDGRPSEHKVARPSGSDLGGTSNSASTPSSLSSSSSALPPPNAGKTVAETSGAPAGPCLGPGALAETSYGEVGADGVLLPGGCAKAVGALATASHLPPLPRAAFKGAPRASMRALQAGTSFAACSSPQIVQRWGNRQALALHLPTLKA